MKHSTLGRLAVADEQRLGAGPSDLDAAEEIGLRAGHAKKPRWLKGGALAEDLGVGAEAVARAAPVLDRAEALHRAVGNPSRVTLTVELLPARDLDLHRLRQRVCDRDA